MGDAASERVPRLVLFLRLPEKDWCSLGEIAGQFPGFNCGYYAAIALGKIGPAAASAVPSLVDALEHNRGNTLVINRLHFPHPNSWHDGGQHTRQVDQEEHEDDRKTAVKVLVKALQQIGTPDALAAVHRNDMMETSLAAPTQRKDLHRWRDLFFSFFF
jgi:hypothetical protein